VVIAKLQKKRSVHRCPTGTSTKEEGETVGVLYLPLCCAPLAGAAAIESIKIAL
jgi:hypothetical protein